MAFQLIQGGYEPGIWKKDRDAYTDEEIALVNEKFRQIGERYPHLREFFEYLMWDIKPQPQLQLIKSAVSPDKP